MKINSATPSSQAVGYEAANARKGGVPSEGLAGLTRDWVIAIVIPVVVTGIVVLWLLHGAGTDLSVPIAYRSDALYHITVMKGIGEGNLPWRNARLRAPFGGSDWRDYPGYQWIDFVAFKFLSLFTNNYLRLFNWYWVLTVMATAATAAYAFLRLRAGPMVASCLAFLFAMQPYIFVRNISHFVLVGYLTPLLATVCLEVALGRWEKNESNGLREIPFYAWAVFLLQGISFFYFSFFGGLLLLAAAFFRACGRRTLRPFVYSAALLSVLGAASVLGVSPSLLHWLQHGYNSTVTQRSAAEAEVNGLKIRHMLTPVPEHPMPVLRNLANKAAASHPEHTEAVGARLGLLAGFGFIGLILYILALLSGWRMALDDGTVAACAALLLTGLLWCTVGGFGSVFNTFVTPLLRGYARIIIMIVFFILAGYGTVVTAFLARNDWARANRWPVAAILVLITASSFADALWFVPQTSEMRREAYAEREFVAAVEGALAGTGMVFQLPYTPFPADDGPGKIEAFDHARPYLQSTALQWSWGTMNGTPEARWQVVVSELPSAIMLSELAEKGFRGLWIDTYGYTDTKLMPAKAIEAQLRHPPLASSDGRYLFFDLTGVHPTAVSPLSDTLPQPYTASAVRAGGSCNVDLINDTGLTGPSISVDRFALLRVDGWMGDVAEGTALPDVYVEFDAADGKRFYLHGSRKERPDVAAAFHKPLLLQAGFMAGGKISILPPGSYSIRIVQLGPDVAEVCSIGPKLMVR